MWHKPHLMKYTFKPQTLKTRASVLNELKHRKTQSFKSNMQQCSLWLYKHMLVIYTFIEG